MPYKISNCKPADVICKCGAIIKWHKMPQHLSSTEHARDIVGCENIEVVNPYVYMHTLTQHNMQKNVWMDARTQFHPANHPPTQTLAQLLAHQRTVCLKPASVMKG
jgi:hypothetical protein